MIFLTAEGTEESAEVAARLEDGIAFCILVLILVFVLLPRGASPPRWFMPPFQGLEWWGSDRLYFMKLYAVPMPAILQSPLLGGSLKQGVVIAPKLCCLYRPILQ